MITTRERITLAEVLRGALARGSAELSDYFRAVLPLDHRHCVFVSQGKAAFEQIVLAAGLQQSRLLVPAFFPDDFVGIFQKYGITPVFVDVDPCSYHLNLSAITRQQLDGAKAMILLHTFGLPADGSRYRSFCDEHGLVLIEDCARALGAATGESLVGSFGHYALFSLPKCTPVREGGIALSEHPMQPSLERPEVGFFGFLHALTLVKYPFTSALEGPLYQLVADTPVYPLEVGNYDPLPSRELDAVGRWVLKAFMPQYLAAIAAKRDCAAKLRQALECRGCAFQTDDGNHICTAISMEPPSECDADEMRAFLLKHGVRASHMWRSALGVSAFAERVWGAQPCTTPVAQRLSRRLIQLPVNRLQTPGQTDRIILMCKRFLSLESRSQDRRVGVVE